MSTEPSYVPPTYEDLELKYESRETPESHILIVHIPDGFAREHIAAKIEFDYGRVRVFGERPLGNNRSSRFNIVYQVPATCDINEIKGEFDSGIVTITMQKKVISKEVPNQELQPITKQEEPKPSVQETESKPEKNKEGIPSESTTGDDGKEKSTAEVKDQKVQEGISGHDPKSTVQSNERVDHDKEVPNQELQPITKQEEPKPSVQETESNPEKNKEGIPSQSTTGDDAKEKSTTEVKDQKVQEGISGHDPKSTVQSNERVDHDTSNLPKVTEESMPQKGPEGISDHDPKSTVQSKEQVEHDTSNLTGVIEETMPRKGQEGGNEEKERVVKEVTKEDTKKTSESGKQPIKDVVERVVKEVTKQDSPIAEKEIKEESKVSSKVEESFVDPKSTNINKENEKKIELNFDHEADEESYGKGIPKSTVKRIKEVAASASEAVTSLTKRFNEEDKQKLIYMGAAVVVVALGVYASYKFRSSPRP